jgi:hypothetical protein
MGFRAWLSWVLAAETATMRGSPFDDVTFQRGVVALAQYRAREGHVRVPRQHAETLYPAGPDGGAVEGDGEVEVRRGVWLSNIKSLAGGRG